MPFQNLLKANIGFELGIILKPIFDFAPLGSQLKPKKGHRNRWPFDTFGHKPRLSSLGFRNIPRKVDPTTSLALRIHWEVLNLDLFVVEGHALTSTAIAR